MKTRQGNEKRVANRAEEINYGAYQRGRWGDQVVIVMSDNRFHIHNHTASLAAAINKAYAKVHGHQFYPCNHDEQEACRDIVPNACKLICIRNAFDFPNAQTVLYLDSDAIFRNFSVTIDDFVEQHLNYTAHALYADQDDDKTANTGLNDRSWFGFDLLVPTDCDKYLFNTGLQLWQNFDSPRDATGNDNAATATTSSSSSPAAPSSVWSARDFMDEWIQRARNHRKFDFEQAALRLWYKEVNSTIRNKVADYISHIAGRWSSQEKERVMKQTIWNVCNKQEEEEQQQHSTTTIDSSTAAPSGGGATLAAARLLPAAEDCRHLLNLTTIRFASAKLS
ncbi:MAG: hypothetical protein SGARI_004750 [Bacillariaceae sp.]